MNGTPSDQPVGSEEIKQEFDEIVSETPQQQEMAESGTEGYDPKDQEMLNKLEELAVELNRFSQIGSDFAQLFKDLLQKAKAEIELLKKVRSDTDLKTKELQRIHKIEVAAINLEQLLEDYQEQKERFETIMSGQRKLWEEEKAQRVRENEKYLEDLRIQRQQEEEEYQRLRALEKIKVEKELEEEMRSMRQRNSEKQEVLEKEWLEREQTLKENEAELARLVKELEGFVAKLAKRTESQVLGTTGLEAE